MSLVLHWSNITSLNPTELFWKIIVVGFVVVGVEDLVEVLDSTFFIHTIHSSESKDGCILLVSPVRELVVAQCEVGTIGVVVFVDHSVPI